jgi:hypothetical protein
MNITATHSLIAVSHVAVAVSPLAYLLYVFMTGLMLELGRRASWTLLRALGCTVTVLQPTPEYCVVAVGGDAQRHERTLCDAFTAIDMSPRSL